jgi:hypothetical protein
MHSRKSWGRVPTIVATLLLKAYSLLTPDQAIDQVRKIVSRHAVQTVKQYNHIHEFDAHRKKEATAKARACALNSVEDVRVGGDGAGGAGDRSKSPVPGHELKLSAGAAGRVDASTAVEVGKVRKSPP